MKFTEIEEKLEALSPSSCAFDWDNPGLQVGRKDKEIKRVFLALDADERTVEEAVSAGTDLLLTHHPMLFHALKKINDETPAGRKVLKLAAHDINVYAMHTNFDISGGMSSFAAEVLGLSVEGILQMTSVDPPAGVGRYGTLPGSETLKDAVNLVKERFGLGTVSVYGDLSRKIHRVAVTPGSGRSMLPDTVRCGADLLITGDIGHHEGLDALEEGISVIDATHAGIERIFVPFMADYLRKNFGSGLTVIEKDSQEMLPNQYM